MLKKLNYVFGLIREYRITTIAGAWVFYFLLAIVPLAFLLITAFNLFNVNLFSIVESPIIEFKKFNIVLMETAENVSKTITVFFIFTVILSASGLISVIAKDSDFIYGITRKRKSSTIRRLFSILALGILFLAFLTVSLIFAFMNKMSNLATSIASGKNYLIIVLFTLVILFFYVIILLLNRFVAPKVVSFSALLLGTLISLFICVLGSILFIIYLRFFGMYNAFYGGLTSIVVFMLWAYILMFGIAIGPLSSKIIFEIQTGEKYDRKFGNVRNQKSHQSLWQ